jgi:hypothetical protein
MALIFLIRIKTEDSATSMFQQDTESSRKAPAFRHMTPQQKKRLMINKNSISSL